MIQAAENTVRDLLDAYLRRHVAASPSWSAQLTATVGQFEAFAGDLAPDDVTADVVADWLRSLVEAGRSPATVNTRRKCLLLLIGDRDVPKLPEPERLPEAWTVDQVERLVAECRAVEGFFQANGLKRSIWWSALAITAYWTGARIGALLAVETADVDLAARSMVARRRKTRKEKLYWLPDQAVAAVAPLYDPARERLFPWPHCRRHLWTVFRGIVERAGLPSSTRGMDLFHRLRRTNVSYTAANGGDDMARRQAGHDSARLTRRHYIDPRIARQESAADVLPRLKIT